MVTQQTRIHTAVAYSSATQTDTHTHTHTFYTSHAHNCVETAYSCMLGSQRWLTVAPIGDCSL